MDKVNIPQDQIMGYLIERKRLLDLLVLSRFMYASGNPIITDAQYDKIETFCRRAGIGQEYLERTYDDDPVPFSLIEEFGLEAELPVRVEGREELYSYLDEEKSLSIKAVTNFEDVWNFVESHRGQRLVRSTKVDGVFTKKLWIDGEFRLGLSRGRSGESWDISDALACVVPRNIPSNEHEIKIYSESYVATKSLEYLREKYDPSKYKTEKSAAISMLRRLRDKEDYEHVKVLVHGSEGLDTTISGTFEKAKELGLETVPYKIIEPEDIPTTFDAFVEWMREELDDMWQMSFDIPSDGMVLEVDDKLYQGDIKNQYSSRNIALKLEHWSFDYYPAIVTELLTDEQKRVNCACKVKIEPMFAKDGTKATVINCFNPGILIKNGINVGSKIFFERNSGAVNILIHGGRLSRLDLDSTGEEE